MSQRTGHLQQALTELYRENTPIETREDRITGDKQ